MILRRLSQSLKEQNWTAIWIEFVLLVAGVFLGIQVANWNQAQADARLGRDYVKRLARDLNQDLASARAQSAYYAAVLDSVRKTDELLREQDPDPRELVINAYRATEITYIAPVRATWDQIVSSGHLGLLPGDTASSELARHYAFDTAQDIYRIGLSSTFRQVIRKIIPIAMQIEMREGCSDVRDHGGYVVGFIEHCQFDADPKTLMAVAAELRSNPAVAAELRYQYSVAVSASLNIDGVKTGTKTALEGLEREMAP
ncbi:MAG: hypothetical protein LH470_04805 [Lysobacter sp.]|nr:hypothetical protein [Lysobacter sp.]